MQYPQIPPDNFKHIRDLIDDLERQVTENFHIRSKSNRVISRSAKTVTPGMSAEFPTGWEEVTGHSRSGPWCILSSRNGRIWSVLSNQRVRTRNPE